MKNTLTYPNVKNVAVSDSFWTPYIEKAKDTMLPYVVKRMEGDGYTENFDAVAAGLTGFHKGPHFSDGLLFETLRAACDFFAEYGGEDLKAIIDSLVKKAAAASRVTDGFLSTFTLEKEPEHRWGENGGSLIYQHDLYNHGALVEAAVSHYNAFGETELLECAVRAANLICAYMGDAPKHNIIPGHSLPEEAFVKLYRLFRDTRELDGFAKKHGVVPENYLEIADFWYRARGNHEGRAADSARERFSFEYNQDNAPFETVRKAVGHSVRAALCYTGAAAVTREYGDGRYEEALAALWKNVYRRKMHISGGIGTRHDIEGFDADYVLPNDAYLEACAAIALAFWAGEMNLLGEKSEYFDCFERALYNNVGSAVGSDFKHFFYKNPLVSNGGVTRWEWHECPCCPPMLLKLFASLPSYIYSYGGDSYGDVLLVNMFIGSKFCAGGLSANLNGKILTVSSENSRPLTLKIRIPEYVKNFGVYKNGRAAQFTEENGYAVIRDAEGEYELRFEKKLRRVFANPKVRDDLGKASVMNGETLMCAEGCDNGGEVDFRLAEKPSLSLDGENVVGLRADGKRFKLIPYRKWCSRTPEKAGDDRMAVWFEQENAPSVEELAKRIGENLYIDAD